jgi:hypothetical protein
VQCFSVETVQNHIVVREDGLEIVVPVIDRYIGSKALNEVETRGARRRRYDCPEALGELNCKRPYAT